jgi:Fe2+ transport system protein B
VACFEHPNVLDASNFNPHLALIYELLSTKNIRTLLTNQLNEQSKIRIQALYTLKLI